MQTQTHSSATPKSVDEKPKRRRSIPKLSGGLPVLGLGVDFQKNPLAVLERGWKQFGNVFSFPMAGKEFVVLAGPKAHDAYFRAAEDHLSAKDVYQFTIPIFGKGVAYDVPTNVMDEQLGFLLPALSSKHLRTYVDHMKMEVEEYIKDWGDKGEIDLAHVTNEITVNIASRCLLGREIRESLYDGFADLYHDLQGGINTLGFFAPKVPTPRHIKRDRARKEVSKLIGGILAARRRTGREEDDFMQTLMAARYKNGRALLDDEITGILLTALFGGQHTSSVLAAWIGIELCQNKMYQDEVLAELEEHYGPLGKGFEEPITLKSLKSTSKLHNAVMECERLHPPLILLVRKVMKDFEYDGFVIPAGKMAMVSPGFSHRLPTVFSDPHVFDPARFAAPRSEHNQPGLTLIGFGGGKHKCIGMGFAYLQLKAIWTVLLHNYTFELSSPAPAPDYSNWVTGPQMPCTLRYERR